MAINGNNDILKSVYFMRRASMICCIFQSLSLSIFVISYNIETVYYLPIFWSISNVVFACNFIRNRNYFQKRSKSVCRKSQFCAICIIHKFNEQKMDKNNKPSSKLMVDHTSNNLDDDDDDDDDEHNDVVDDKNGLNILNLDLNATPLPKLRDFHSNPVFTKRQQKHLRGFRKKEDNLCIQIELLKG